MNRPTLLLIAVVASLAMLTAALLATESALTREVTASYDVRGDSIVLVEGEPEPWHQTAWDRWVEMVPTPNRWRVGRFEAIEGANDGQVEPISDSLQVWILRIAELEDQVLDVALIHELGHLVSLGPDEVVPAIDPSIQQDCITYFSIEGCAIPGGVFDRFVSTFWDPEDGWESSDQATRRRHQRSPDSFVTEYAATNPGEDLAETFVFFVYRLRPTGTSVAEEKIGLLWEFPHLVELRQALRRSLR